MSYIKAVYRTVLTMTPFYIENFCLWVKTAVWDAPRRIYLDVDLEKQKIERDLSRVGDRQSSGE